MTYDLQITLLEKHKAPVDPTNTTRQLTLHSRSISVTDVIPALEQFTATVKAIGGVSNVADDDEDFDDDDDDNY